MAAPAPGGGRFGLAPDRQRLLVIAGGGVVALLIFLLLVLPKLAGGGGGGGSTAQPPLVRPPRSSTTTTIAPRGGPAESFEVFNTKNPFQPLINPTSAGGGSTSATVPAGSTGGGTTQTTVAGGGVGTGGATGGAATAPRRSQQVALLNVYAKGGETVADVRVNDTVYTAVAPGQTFASNFQLVSLQGQCGTFLFGDERFQLCKGEEVLK
ncbi:MAG: hypothetical protein JOZ68_18235 [Acidimicrobiia bacterium]|nr:hypothetical protein [Acidimicrobiia bacterium]MBV9042944.1 hypothetical protein [Acidimicrobiia bacterium]